MATEVKAWKDRQQKLHKTKKSAEEADAQYEIEALVERWVTQNLTDSSCVTCNHQDIVDAIIKYRSSLLNILSIKPGDV